MSTYGRDSWAPDAMFREQRAKELLRAGIPEGEATKCSNGRWSCLVCPQRPVFDTIAILCIHRNGRKHKTVLERILAQKNKGKRNALDEDADAVGPKRASLKRKSMSGAQEAPLVTSTRNTVTETLKSATPTVSPQTAAPAPTISPNLYQQINPSAPPSDSTPYYCYYPGPYYPYYPYSYGNYYYPAQEAQPEEPAPPCSAPQQAHSTTQEATTSSVGEEERPQKKRKEEDDPPTEKEKIYYEKLRQLGWLRDVEGNLHKDLDAEFDSDEELPPDPLSLGIDLSPPLEKKERSTAT